MDSISDRYKLCSSVATTTFVMTEFIIIINIINVVTWNHFQPSNRFFNLDLDEENEELEEEKIDKEESR